MNSQTLLRSRPTGEEATQRTLAARRLWVLTNAPSPYQVELFNAAARREDLELSVRYMRSGSPSGRSVEAASDSDSIVMRATLPQSCRDELRLHPRAVWDVIRGRHDVYVLSGLYTSPTFVSCAIMSVLLRRKIVLWLERPRASRKERAGWIGRAAQSIKQRYLHWLMRRVSAIWCIGSRAEQEYQQLTEGRATTRVLPYCCRIDRFDVNPSAVAELRSRHELADHFVFLFSGQLIRRKGVDTLLAAFAKATGKSSDSVLLVLGDGPAREELAAISERLGIGARVRFLGHRPQSELPEWFALANAFVFPSRHDGWAVVINEACAAGLPILASSQTGAAHDLVREGINGFVLDCDDVDGWAARMEWCLAHRAELPGMGLASRQLVERFSSQAGAARMAEYTEELLSPPVPVAET
jgi:glycosyltransferase involved in cell wall biosynthesis